MSNVTCAKCPAACCRWQAEVLWSEEDRIPEEMIEVLPGTEGMAMKRDPATGYCVALDTMTFKCSIYENRPDACQKFPVGEATGCLSARSQMSAFQMRQAR